MILRCRSLFILFLIFSATIVGHDIAEEPEENDANFTDSGGGERSSSEAANHDKDNELRSPIDCNFDEKIGFGGMCSWRADGDDHSGIWHTGNAALVDSVNSIVKPGLDDRFAFVTGHVDAASEGSLESQILRNAPGITNQLQFSYWKAAFGPILDVCLKTVVDSRLECIDSITGAGAQQWTQRTLTLPRLNEPFKIIFRARNIHSAEDLIGLDDIKMRMIDDSSTKSPTITNDLKDVESKSDPRAYGSPILFNSFEMRRAQPSAVIQPAVLQSKTRSPIPLDEEKLPVQDESPLPSIVRPATKLSKPTTTTTPSPPPSILFHHHSPIPNSKKFDSNFPDFPSFENIDSSGGSPVQIKPTKIADNPESCKAVKCSFLETTCLWHLGKHWKIGEGNIAIDQNGEDAARSGYFKAPFATFFEFDLWMTNDATLSIVQETREFGQPGADELSLFERHGMENKGWHRFRVPLRPAFNPIRLLIRANLPTGSPSYATISNTRLVTANGEEANCETTAGASFMVPPAISAPGIPVVSAGPPSWAGGVPVMNGRLQTSGELTTMNAADSNPTLPPSLSPLSSLMGSPLSMPALDAAVHQQPAGMIDGMAPIIPMKDNAAQRLTAFQRLPTPFVFPTLAPLPTVFDQPAPSHSMSFGVMPSPMARPTTGSPIAAFDQPSAAPADPFGNTDIDLVLSTTPESSVNSIVDENRIDRRSGLGTPQSARDLADRSTVDRLLTAIAGQPILEQQLRQFAQRVGFDASNVPDRAALTAQIRRLFGPKAISLLDATAGNQLPLSVASAVQTHRQNGDMEETVNGGEEMQPIRPTNVKEEDFQRAVAQDAMKRLNVADGNTEMLKRLTSFLGSPNTDDQSPWVRERLDSTFQNAING
ncbi:MAM domain and Concanavalin A-like lectin/glucanases superfamily domain-containing protein [Aphelenchoides besseyi]|nr:MAM domain and Concanavalin A-like lectin/glucanases superfamily domain-containing protein [Aphelenchoides besseyi]